MSNRWVILKHIGAPDDVLGMHFDLLLEDETICRTWRLNEMPNHAKIFVEAIRLPNHSLRWLEIKESSLSRGRGYVTRIDSGIYQGYLPKEEKEFLQIEIVGDELSGLLEIDNTTCRIL